MEILVINVNVSYRKVTSTWFSELLPCLLFLKNHQPKISLMPKRCILEWYILPHSVFFFIFVDLCLFWPICCSCISISGTSRDRHMCWVHCWIRSLLSLQATTILPFLGFLDSVLEAVHAILFSWNILLCSLWIILLTLSLNFTHSGTESSTPQAPTGLPQSPYSSLILNALAQLSSTFGIAHKGV